MNKKRRIWIKGCLAIATMDDAGTEYRGEDILLNGQTIEAVGPAVVEIRYERGDADSLIVVAHGQIRFAQIGVKIAATEICLFVSGIKLNGLVIILNGLLILPQIGVDCTSVSVSIGELGV